MLQVLVLMSRGKDLLASETPQVLFAGQKRPPRSIVQTLGAKQAVRTTKLTTQPQSSLPHTTTLT